MDRLTRNSIIISAFLFLFLIVTLAWDRYGATPRVWQLNTLLEEDPVLAQSPYRFRVTVFLNGIATLTSPLADLVSIETYVKTADPSLADKPADDAALQAAERAFRETEMRAIAVMLAEPDVDSVVWSLDRAWYHKHGVRLEMTPGTGI
ncbi:hypothetical protein ThidrDRAFT_0871 [Thiorhodococcus drewsii AZ1]|uniref:Uncharacterized protein n=1 Tax=Thiorhodococcus drewsii AZ1 TaxID=765913 RepID=G2DXG1_9GAMM|nr:hypothetical protein [Thiorhodococcus drewsii]EGV33193.1 hypothetical protein ThidrDRAFT_0871 [Thiorhodococcus drewsii AZ1]